MAALPHRRSTRLLEQKQDWSTVLPPELWERVGARLSSACDAANFQSMCGLWRDELPFTKFPTVLMMPFDPEGAEGTVRFYRPTEGKTFMKNLPALHDKEVFGSSHGWLALVEDVACLTLLNPFTQANGVLPPTRSPPRALVNGFRRIRQAASSTSASHPCDEPHISLSCSPGRFFVNVFPSIGL